MGIYGTHGRPEKCDTEGPRGIAEDRRGHHEDHSFPCHERHGRDPRVHGLEDHYETCRDKPGRQNISRLAARPGAGYAGRSRGMRVRYFEQAAVLKPEIFPGIGRGGAGFLREFCGPRLFLRPEIFLFRSEFFLKFFTEVFQNFL